MRLLWWISGIVQTIGIIVIVFLLSGIGLAFWLAYMQMCCMAGGWPF